MTSKIEWLRSADGKPGYTVNPVKGLCPVDCKDNQGKSYCYARRMYKRFGWDTTIAYDESWAVGLTSIKNLARIFVGSTMELFGDWVEKQWLKDIFNQVLSLTHYTQHTFIFLTKRPQNLPRKWPDNCWVGVSATNGKMVDDAGYYLSQVQARVKFLSIEPLLERIQIHFGKSGISWVIIGAQTPYNPKTGPKIEWVKEIVEAADKAGIPVFLKNNLSQLFWRDAIKQNSLPLYALPEWAGRTSGYYRHLRQEFPKVWR